MSARRFPTFVLMTLFLAFLVVPTFAQATPTPITLGENQTAEISGESITAGFSLSATAGLPVTVQVLGVTPGFAPVLRVLDPLGTVVLEMVNSAAASSVQVPVMPAQTGTYLLEVSSGNGSGGQFVISVQPSTLPEPLPIPLIVGQAVPGSVNAQASRQPYTFSADPAQPLLLLVTSDQASRGPSVTLKDASTGDVLGTGSLRLIGIVFRVPAGSANYRADIAHGGSDGAEAYTVLLQGDNAPAVPGSDATPAATPSRLTSTGPCVVASLGGERINVRSGPSTSFAVVARLEPNQIGTVVGRLGDNSWYQIDINGVVGWVAAFVVTVGGDQCEGVPILAAPGAAPAATAAPTQPAQPTVAPPPDQPAPSPTPFGPPDLIISSVQVAVDATTGTVITVTVSNVGTGVAGANELHVQFPNSDISQRALPALNPGQSTTQSFTNAASTVAGNWQANVDAIGVIAESNESNNNASGSVS